MENSPIGYEISLEPASDADLDENGRINYELKRLDENNNDGPFELVTKINGGLTLKVIKVMVNRKNKVQRNYLSKLM
jgi:hypothetical protein